MPRRCVLFGVALSLALGAAGEARAQNSSMQEMKAQIDELTKKNDQLERQYQQLMQMMQPGGYTAQDQVVGAPPAGISPTQGKEEIRKIVQELKKEDDDKKKAKDDEAKAKAEAEGYKIGSEPGMKVTWKDGVVISTTENDFWMHIGGWIQYDNVWWTQSNFLRQIPGARPGKAQGVFTGVAGGGIGDLEDGTYFRRLRLMTDGVFWENYEFTLIYAFENDQFETIGLDEFWVGVKDVPVLGTARIGHVKNCIGLEADMTGSSRTMTFMERSSYSEAIEENQNFVTGIWLGNNYFDKRATWSFVAFRPDQGSSSGAFFGDGQYGLQGRLTALPLYECDGRHLMHVGVSGGWRDGSNNIANSPFRTVQLRARPELRDDDPAGSAGDPQVIPNANSNRMVDTNAIICNNNWLLGLEYLYIRGPFSLQAEYGFNWLEDAVGVPNGNKITPIPGGPRNYLFNGGYVQAAYTLTGENRSYDKRLGRLDTYYFGRQGPYTNAWFVRDECGGLNCGLGAWEIAARYSFVDLNDGPDGARIQGGAMDGMTVGLNWYLNTNLKFQFDYVYNHRFDLPQPGTATGYTSGFGVRMQFMY
jgi:phosphate-selective porin OprO/OprP